MFAIAGKASLKADRPASQEEVREQLLQEGHIFRTQSDTEVIFHVYGQYGDDCVDHLQGMFAFGIWDARRRRLFVARDRVGIKPLYYCLTPQALHFASVPPCFNVEGIETKRLLNDAFRNTPPAAVLNRKKAGFPVPQTLLSQTSHARGYFHSCQIENLLDINDPQGSYPKEIFFLLILELWHQRFLPQSRSGMSHLNPITQDEDSLRAGWDTTVSPLPWLSSEM